MCISGRKADQHSGYFPDDRIRLFNMMMVVDRTNATNSFGDMADEMEKVGEEIGVVIKCQREEIFDKMHRI